MYFKSNDPNHLKKSWDKIKPLYLHYHNVMTNKLDRMVPNLEELLLIMLLDPLVTWPWDIVYSKLKPLYLHYYNAYGHKTL